MSALDSGFLAAGICGLGGVFCYFAGVARWGWLWLYDEVMDARGVARAGGVLLIVASFVVYGYLTVRGIALLVDVVSL